MNRPVLTLVLALLFPSLPAARAPAAAEPALGILRVDLRSRDEAAPRARLRLDGDITAGPGLAAFDPRSERFRVSVGLLVLVDLPSPGVGPRYRETRSGWRLEIRDAFGGRGRVLARMDPLTGLFTLTARGFVAGDLLANGTAAVPVVVQAGNEVYATTLDLDEARPGRWSYRRVVPPRPPPGIPPGSGGLSTLAAGDQSGITSMRFEVVRDAAAWAALWQEHAGGGTPPSVDFASRMVVGIWLGMKPTTGHTVRIQRIVAPYMVVTGGWCIPCPDCGVPCFGGDTTPGFLAEVLEIAPGPGCVSGQAVTFPFHIVSVPRVEGPGVFQLQTATYCP